MTIHVPTIKKIKKLIALGQCTCFELASQAIDKIEKHKARHDFITVDFELVKQQAKLKDSELKEGQSTGQLHGILIAVKDNIHVARLPNTAGTAAFKQFIPESDALVIKRLKKAGAIIVGKANMHELAYGITSDNKTFGAVSNVVNQSLIAGGSSGGSATSVALGMAHCALGTDTGGSARIPAALNGLVGFRPTIGRYPNEGITSISHTRDTVGPITNTVEDAQVLDAILSATVPYSGEVCLSKLRIGIPKEYFYDNLEADIAHKTQQLLECLTQAGVTLVYENLHAISELNSKISFPVVLYETKQQLSDYLNKYQPNLTLEKVIEQIDDPNILGIMSSVMNGDISSEVYEQAIKRARPQLQALYNAYFKEHQLDAILVPTSPLTAKPIATNADTVDLNGQQVPTFTTFIRNTDPSSNAGIPSLSIPLSQDNQGLPFGIQLDGPHNSDQKLLAIGHCIEQFIKTIK